MVGHDPHYVGSIVNSGSSVLGVTAQGPGRPTRPAPSPSFRRHAARSHPDLQVAIGGTLSTTSRSTPLSDGTAPTTVAPLAVLFERKLRQPGTAFGGVRVHVVGQQIQVVAGPADAVRFSLTGASDLGLEGTANPGAYPLTGGADGPRRGADLIGSAAGKTGIHALRDVLDVNLLCLPELADAA